MTDLPRPRRARRLLAAALTSVVIGAAGALGIAAPAHAAPIEVTSTSGAVGDIGSLPWAVDLANQDAAADTITFDLPPGSTITIVDLITVEESLTITGPGEGDLTVESFDTVFTADATAGTSLQIDVSITDITLATSTGVGCGIDAVNTNLTVANLTANGFDCSGISVFDGSLEATDVTLLNNGTGISFASTTTPTPPVTITRADTTGSLDGIAGGSEDGTVTLTDVTADDSTLSGISVGMSGSNAVLTMTNTRTGNAFLVGHAIVLLDGATAILTRPSALGLPGGSPGQGMLFQVEDATLTMTGATVSNNDAGGVWVDALDSTVSITDSVIDSNGDAGGCGCGGSGLYLSIDDSEVDVRSTEITGNRGDSGGGILVDLYEGASTLTIADSQITGNTAETSGGGIWLFDIGGGAVTGPVTITRTTISGNETAGEGGGISLENFSFAAGSAPLLLIEQSTISGNRSGDAGGGLFLYKDDEHDPGLGVVDIVDSTISGNTAVVGGGIFAYTDSALTDSMSTRIRHSTVANNVGDGGVAFEGTEQQVVLDHALIAGNGATDLDFFDDPELVTLAYSLVQEPGSGVVIPAGLGNQSGVNPLLGPLADNGGPTLTHTLLEGSPAFNKGNPAFVAPPSVDQRGLPRVVQIIDIGAVERTVTLPATGSNPDGAALLAAALLVVGGALLALRARSRSAR